MDERMEWKNGYKYRMEGWLNERVRWLDERKNVMNEC